MNITRVSIKKMYGSYTQEVMLRDDINLLVGINGSGKTTILNCIDWMLRPDLASLAATNFEHVIIDFTLSGKDYSICAKQTKEKMTLRETKSSRFPDPITIDFIQHPASIKNETEYQFARERYKSLGPEKSETKLWSFLCEINSPLTITLDRSISAEVDDDVFVDSGTRTKSARGRRHKSPLEKVQEVTRERYAKYRSSIYDLNEGLKTKLVISAFKNPFGNRIAEHGQGKNKKPSLETIVQLEQRVNALLAASLGAEDASSHIKTYFREARQFAQHAQKNKGLLEIFWRQYHQIDELTEAFDEYEKNASSAYEDLGSFINAVNSFFRDSKKHLLFDEMSGSLMFRFESDSQEQGYRPLERLSSGERQILILLTFLAFVSERAQIFIVDEPELSLHPKWQSYFIDAVISQAPVETQIIMATHSPEIVGKHRQYCKILDRKDD